MEIELLCFDGCPSYMQAEEELRSALDELGIPGPIRRILVRDDDEAERLRFIGSPTIRVDGRDLEPEVDRAEDFGLRCRIYFEGGAMRGWPSRAFILAALRRKKRD